jgi:hypothetical protein
MTPYKRDVGSRFALGAFVLTLLLGFGGVSASALWQQSATATMSVTANGAWPGPPLTSLTCTNDSPQKVATLRVTLPTGPANVTYAALQPNGSFGSSYQGPLSLLGLTPGNIVLTGSPAASQILKDNPAGFLTIRVSATYVDQTVAHLDITLNNSVANGKIICP